MEQTAFTWKIDQLIKETSALWDQLIQEHYHLLDRRIAACGQSFETPKDKFPPVRDKLNSLKKIKECGVSSLPEDILYKWVEEYNIAHASLKQEQRVTVSKICVSLAL